jgi:hypothetical protein
MEIQLKTAFADSHPIIAIARADKLPIMLFLFYSVLGDRLNIKSCICAPVQSFEPAIS